MAFADLVARIDRAAQAILGGEPVVYQAGGVPPGVTVTGMFDTPFVLAQGGELAGVEARRVSVFFRLEDLPSDPIVDNPIIVRGGVSYRVTERDPDGLGGITLHLRKVV